ncbi:MAG: hypothetical protein HLUCCA11_09060 [Phormidesmis priestleyi Ana]|uniref:Ribbon-helix-helix protein, copG family n=1 Tax=Phormidesmis priestleyi Ana TaxID=1666911 RepID=A0A0P7YX34_9CYAN|nr:MAG: hypothetical protein HLUCCA11_09060 [Phormidesmis priestleyi Ana]
MTSKEKDMPQTTQVSAKQKRQAVTDKKRLNLELAPAAYELLQRLADDSGKSLADVLRTGLALYGIAQDAKQEGRGIGVIEGDAVVKEILLT